MQGTTPDTTGGLDRPETRTVLDVHVPDRDDALVSWVLDDGGDAPDGGDLVVTVGQDRTGLRVRVPVGEQVELVWQGPTGPRALTVEVAAVELGDDPVWRLRPLGEAVSAQRRQAVRTPIGVPVTLHSGDASWDGVTVDLSEAGLRGRWRVPLGAGPELPGDIVRVAVQLDVGDVVAGPAALVRVHGREGALEASFRFLELTERDEDRVRARVFARMRELRRRGDA